MFKNLRIGTKITILVIIIVLISVISVSLIAFNLSRQSVEERYLASINTIAKLKAEKVETFFDKVTANLIFGSQLSIVKDKLRAHQRSNASQVFIAFDTTGKKDPKEDSLTMLSATVYDSTTEAQLQEILQSIEQLYQISFIYLTDAEGNIISEYGENRARVNVRRKVNINDDKRRLTFADQVIAYSNVYKPVDSLNVFKMLAAANVYDQDKSLLGRLVYEIDMSYVYSLAADITGLGTTGEIILARREGNNAVYLNPLRQDSLAPLRKRVRLGEDAHQYLQEAVKGRQGSGFARDYRGEAVLATWRTIPGVEWGVIVKIDQSEINRPTDLLRNAFLIAGLVIIFISLVLGILFSRLLINPLLSLRQVVNLLARGVLPSAIPQSSEDEIGEMAGQLNQLVENLKKTVSFAQSIGQGELDTEFSPISEEDALGVSLIGMRDSIRTAAMRDEEQNWIVVGRAEIGDILRSQNNIETLGEAVIEYITKRINAVQGAFYTTEAHGEDLRDNELVMTASYAYNKKKYLNAKFKFAEGLVGQAAIEQDTIVRTEIPDEYVTITSGILGDRKPKCILIRPLITLVDRQEQVLGVMEFAGFERFSERNVRFVEEISEIIARTVYNIQVTANTQRLLEASQKLSTELQDKQAVLSQNAEIMAAQNEELQVAKNELEFRIEEVHRANEKTRLLLENASEVITIYRENKEISYISPSVEKILGYTQDEMIGMSDTIYIEEGKEAFQQMFQNLILNPRERITIQFSYRIKHPKEDGHEVIWLEATGTNLLDDPAIQGIVVNSRDITERRLVEAEQRMRGQMQALSENSPDLITRISKDGRIFYINPVIENYTGKNKDAYLQQHIDEVEIPPKVLNQWKKSVEQVLTEGYKISFEMDFHSDMGKRIMQVDAIPEYNDQKIVESVLLVSHDITERKIIELEVQNTNKKITESINYAKRIQEAILPDNELIRNYLPQSFILYKPRDVVSGDFPWFYKKGDDIYLAAVDCTGHGVPGALISLIGYFLLNNILGRPENLEPSKILDLLDAEVVETLKQNLGSNSRDGMDISLCKINVKTQTLSYAGAHRPLYYLPEGGHIEELKGDKYPIGGAQYKNRSEFNNIVVSYKPGDAFFIFSDGFPDQFGGPENRKFSPRRIRDIILKHKHEPVDNINNALEQALQAWQGDNKQTDDILLIGVKF
jgi:PAS domain S-box-containing protein